MESIVGTDSNDILLGNDSDEILYGLDGADIIYAGGGDDFSYGGLGDDVIYPSPGADVEDGGEGNDTLALIGGTTTFKAVTFDLGLGVAYLTDTPDEQDVSSNFENFWGGYDLDGNWSESIWDHTVFGTDEANEIITSEGNDAIYGRGGNDIIYAGGGDDFSYGGPGNDVIYPSAGTDLEDGGDGDDTLALIGDTTIYKAVTFDLGLGVSYLTGTPDDQHVSSNFENFWGGYDLDGNWIASIWDHTIYGTDGENEIITSAGVDTITGREGNDTIDGGTGDDTAVFAGNRSNYTITNLDGVLTVKDNVGTDGIDTLTNIEKLQFADATWDVTDLVFDEETDDEGTVQENTEGADVFIGTAGIDKVVYNNARADIDVSVQDGVVRISNGDITDELTDIERISFIDTSIALDVDGNAGSTAKILGAVFGKAALANKAYAGIGLSLLDSGEHTYESLMDYALTVAGAQSNEQVVELLYTNAVGVVPTTQQVQAFVALLDDGTYTRASLGALAAEYAVSSITLAGLAETGLEYTPFG